MYAGNCRPIYAENTVRKEMDTGTDRDWCRGDFGFDWDERCMLDGGSSGIYGQKKK